MLKEIDNRIIERSEKIKAVIEKTDQSDGQLKKPEIKNWSDFTNTPPWGDFSKGGDPWRDFSKIK